MHIAMGKTFISVILLLILAAGNGLSLHLEPECSGCSHCHSVKDTVSHERKLESNFLDRFIHHAPEQSGFTAKCVVCALEKHSNSNQRFSSQAEFRLIAAATEAVIPPVTLIINAASELTLYCEKADPSFKTVRLLC